MLKYYKIESGRIAVAPNEDAADIVIMGSLSQEQRSVLVKEYEITEHTIASAFDSDELSRIEYDDDFISFLIPHFSLHISQIAYKKRTILANGP